MAGQVGAILLGISRALQNWEPDLRPPLRAGMFISRLICGYQSCLDFDYLKIRLN